MKIPWDDEADAEAVVTDKLGGTVRDDRDPGGGAEQVRDFHLDTDTTSIAFEVTRHTDGTQEATLDAIDKLNWRFDALAFDWYLGMRDGFNAKRLHRSIPKVFGQLESTGIRDAHFTYDEDLPAEVPEVLIGMLQSLGVKYVRRGDPAGPEGALVHPRPSGGGGSTASVLLVELAEREAIDAGNLKKLQRADADERHLFIWVDSKATTTFAAFVADLPKLAPKLPAGVDAVWVVEAIAEPSARVWQYHRRHGWRDLGRWRRQVH